MRIADGWEALLRGGERGAMEQMGKVVRWGRQLVGRKCAIRVGLA